MSEASSKPKFTYKKPSKIKVFIKKIILLLVLAGLGIGGWYGYHYWEESNKEKITFKTSKVEKRIFEHVIEATGTLEPEELIDVGAQVGGRIIEFGKDAHGKEIDYGSVVKEGDILARIDDELIQSDIRRAEASVNQAKASVDLAKADIEDAKIKYELAKIERERAEKLGPSEALAKSAYDTYITNEKSAKNTIATREATLARALATLDESEASLAREKRNLTYTQIISPVDGIIIDRRVNIGQTVVSSMSAPSLFLIAKDLSKMEIWTAVNEADIGSIKAGQEVTFTVDAFPGKTFTGAVQKVRLNATMSSNVVTYIVEVTAPNPEKILLPYLTTNTRFIVKRWNDAFTVSNAALRWTPEPTMVVPGTTPPEGKRIWVKDGDFVKPITVEVEETDGTISVIVGEGLSEGLEVVQGIVTPDPNATPKKEEEATNPFAPKMPRRPRR